MIWYLGGILANNIFKFSFLIFSLFSGYALGGTENDRSRWIFEAQLQFNSSTPTTNLPSLFTHSIPEIQYLGISPKKWDEYVTTIPLENANQLKYLRLFGHHDIFMHHSSEGPPIVAIDNYFENAGARAAPYIFNLPHLETLEGLNLDNTCLLYPTELEYSPEQLWKKISSFTNLRHLNVQNNPHLNLTGIEALQDLTNFKELLLGGWVSRYDITKPQIDDLTPLAALTQIEKLSLSPINNTDLSPLGKMSALKILELEQPNSPNLTPLASLTHLESLFLYNHANLQGLGQSQSLQVLYLTAAKEIQLEKESLCKEIGDLVSLKSLFIDGSNYNLEVILPILTSNQQSNLSSVIFYPSLNQINNNYIEFTQKIGELERKVIDYRHRTAENWEILQLIPHIQSMAIKSRYPVDDMKWELETLNLSLLAVHTDLEDLDLSFWALNEWQLEQLAEITLPNLKNLSLANPKGLPFETFAPELRKLNLNDSNASGGDIKQIAKLTLLEELNVASCSITSTAIAHLAKSISPIKKIDFSFNNLKGADFGKLKALTFLEELNLQGANISKEDFFTLKELQTLIHLDIRQLPNINIGQEQIEQLRQSMPHCTILSD